MHRVFGAPQPGLAYRIRPGAYGVAFDRQGNAAMVYCREKGYFLLGGGIEPGESEEACLRREALEEAGLSVALGDKICIGEEYVPNDTEGRPLHPVGHVYLMELGERIAEPVEPDHSLVWLPVDQCREKMFLHFQAWAVETAWAYQMNKLKEKD